MKKQVAIVCLSFTSLLVFNTLTPQALWLAGKDQFELSRSPATIDPKITSSLISKPEVKTDIKTENKTEVKPDDKTEVKKEEAKTADTKTEKKKTLYVDIYSGKTQEGDIKIPYINEEKHEDKKDDQKAASDALVSCIKEKNDNLQQEVEKLVADKEIIMKELKELRIANARPKEEEKTSKEDKKEDKKAITDAEKKDAKLAKVVPDQNTSMLSQFTSLLMSQQQQQLMMMAQLFGMSSAPQATLNIPQAPSIGMNAYTRMQQQPSQMYMLNDIGVSLAQEQYNNAPMQQQQQPFVMVSPYSIQQPMQQQMQMIPQQMQSMQNYYSQRPIQNDGFDFSSNDVTMKLNQPMVRTQIN